MKSLDDDALRAQMVLTQVKDAEDGLHINALSSKYFIDPLHARHTSQLCHAYHFGGR